MTFFPPLILHSALHLANQIRLSYKNKTLGASISNQCLNVQPWNGPLGNSQRGGWGKWLLAVHTSTVFKSAKMWHFGTTSTRYYENFTGSWMTNLLFIKSVFFYKGLHHSAPLYIQYLLTISYQKRNPFDRPRQIYMLLPSPIWKHMETWRLEEKTDRTSWI